MPATPPVLPPWTNRIKKRVDSLQLLILGTEIRQLHALMGNVGMPGVEIEHVAGRNGPGMGMLRLTGDGDRLAWRAPGSSAFNTPVVISGDGQILLMDGDDPDKYLRVQIHADHLPAGPMDCSVLLIDVVNNGIGHDNVTAAEAAGGDVSDYTITLKNHASTSIFSVTVWLDAATTLLEISDDGLAWVSPVTEGAGLSFGTIGADASKTLYIRRTIPGATASDPAVLNLLHLSFVHNATKTYQAARGVYRIFNSAVYRCFRGNTPPQEGDAPLDTNATLPHEPADAYADGTWYLSLSRFNGCMDSGFLPVGPRDETYLMLVIAGGQQQGNPPEGPAPGSWNLELRPGGVVRINAFYHEGGDDRAGEWAIAYTTDGGAPPEDAPDITQAIPGAGLAVLSHDLPAQADGTTVKVRLQTRRNDGTPGSPSWVYSDDSIIKTATADAGVPSAPLAADTWPGSPPEEL